MHHALEIQEILLHVFGHCRPGPPSRRRATPGLVALAATCRAFKEPALDLLWEELDDLSPLVRCLPEAFHHLPAENEVDVPHELFIGNKYSLSRLLTRTEWSVLLGYAHRIRSIIEITCKLDEESFRYLSHPPTSQPLLPNLRHLRCEYKDNIVMSVLGFPFPSLTSLDLVFNDAATCDNFFNTYPTHPNPSPNLTRFCFRVRTLEDRLIRIEHEFVSRWRHIQSIVCPQITLDVETLAYLSHMSALTRLTFKHIVILPASNSPLCFSKLRYLTVHAPFLGPISRLLSLIRIPAITDFAAIIDSCPSKRDLSSLLSNLETSNVGSTRHTLESLVLEQTLSSMPTDRGRDRVRGSDSDPLVLGLANLQPCTVYPRLHTLKVNLACNVRLGDDDIVALASAWPRLQRLVINASAGWNVHLDGGGGGGGTGVTPSGMRRLLSACRELWWVALVLDTRGYTVSSSPPEPLDRRTPSSSSTPAPAPTPTLTINVLDAALDAHTVLAIAAFFATLVPGGTNDVSMGAWGGGRMVKPEGWEACKVRWQNVFRLAQCWEVWLWGRGAQAQARARAWGVAM